MLFMPKSPKSSSPRRAALAPLRVRFAWRWHTWRFAHLKRGLDIFCALAALLALSPLLLIIALLIRLEDGGPVLFWQARVGRYGREFPFPKFRSMVVDADRRHTEVAHLNQHGVQGVTFKHVHDPRITRIGRFIRRTSIDELPQLWCVLKGDMALVGPRPPLPREVARYTQADRDRLVVKPGLTCIWQVSGRSEIPFPKQVALDVDYIRERSLWLDLKLLSKTVPAIIHYPWTWRLLSAAACHS
jgi:lipopolysaccharide/colanic/teichoic acid biosynthesis glycosyltransferase